MVTMLAGIAVLTAQPAHTQFVQREMINNMTMMLLNDNPMPPDSSVTFKYDTNERISKIDYLKFDDMYCTEQEIFLYDKDPARSKVETTYGRDYPTYCGLLGYDRILRIEMSVWESGEYTLISTITYTYDSEGLLTEVDDSYHHYTVISEKNDQNQIISESLTFTSDPISVYQTRKYEYGANEKVTSESMETTSTYGEISISNIIIYTYTYDAEDLLIETLTHEIDNESIEKWTKDVFIGYDSDGRISRSDHYEGSDLASLTCTEYILTYYSSVGIAEITQETAIAIYPNPTTGLLTICDMRCATSDIRQSEIEIFDVMGRMVMTVAVETLRATSLQSPITPPPAPLPLLPSAFSPKEKKRGNDFFGGEFRKSEIGKSDIEIDISHLPVGIYFIRITTENGVVTKKVMKN